MRSSSRSRTTSWPGRPSSAPSPRNLGQQPGLNEALTAVGDLLDEGLIGIVQALLEAVN